MTRNQPNVLIECDNGDCTNDIEISLTTTARGYDERDVDNELKESDWIVDGEYEYCSEDCYKMAGGV